MIEFYRMLTNKYDNNVNIQSTWHARKIAYQGDIVLNLFTQDAIMISGNILLLYYL